VLCASEKGYRVIIAVIRSGPTVKRIFDAARVLLAKPRSLALESGGLTMASRSKRRVMMQFAGPENLSDSIVLPAGRVNLMAGEGRL
jgi:hypothetical protein